MKREEIAKYAYENVPFYQELHDGIHKASWEEYPVIDKDIVRERKDALFAPEYMMDYLGGRLEHVMTSGSTGDCLDIFWEKTHNIKSLISLWRKRKLWYGIMPDDRRCYFFTTKIVGGEELMVERTAHGLGFSKMDLSQDKIISIYEEMLSFDPKWMIVQPSIIMLFMKAIQYNKMPLSLHVSYIELTGERVDREVKEKIADFFECDVADQYGCYEVNSIAYECPCGNMHVMSENVYVEMVEDDSICVTSLHNKVMPFIRYKVGDRGRLIYDINCQCGCKEPIIELYKGRENDWIYNEDGSVCHSDIFCHVIDMINLELQQAILQYQIVQTDYKFFEVYIVAFDRAEIGIIEALFQKNYEIYQPRSEFTFFFVDYLYPCEKTGKLAWFITKLEGGNKNV